MLQNLAIYIHYPFCKAKCPYCDFNSHAEKTIDEEKFSQAYLQEIDYFAQKLKNRTIKTIFFGGGTPSLMPVSLVAKILDKLNSVWSIATNAEITLEANPTSFESQKFSDFKKAGINRLSLGIQALNDEDLKFLGRQHTSSEAIEVIKKTSDIFDNYSFDLIYGRPKQKLQDWQNELEQAIKLSAHHLSLYQLTIEKGTKFYKMQKNQEFIMPNNDLAADFYEITNEITEKYGLDLYEISNYAKEYYQCQHNLAYWKSQDYLGLGAGAHSRIKFTENKNRVKIMMFHKPEKWQNEIFHNNNAIQELTEVNNEELLEEILLMGLRLKEGINNKIFLQYFNKTYQELLDAKKLDILQKQNLLCLTEDFIKVTDKGRIITNSIIRYCLD